MADNSNRNDEGENNEETDVEAVGSPGVQASLTLCDLAAALATAQLELEAAVKDKQNPHLKNKYADLASVWEAWQKVGPKNGLAVLQIPVDDNNRHGISLVTMLMHKSGQFITGRMFVPSVKWDAQGLGSALTYARRYSLAAMVGVCPDDDDGNAASGKVAKEAQAKADQETATKIAKALEKFKEDETKLSMLLQEATKLGNQELVDKASLYIKELKDKRNAN